jgi:hypothetical protein
VSIWLNAVATSAENDFGAVGDAIEYFDALYEVTNKNLNVKGKVLIDIGWKLAGLADTVYASWSEIKAICELLELRKNAAIGKARKQYIEHYNRDLSQNQVENYAKVDPAVVEISQIIIHMQFILNKWEGLSKAIERLHYQIRLIGDMRRAGMEDATI